ncbi:MAG TPA: efflux RND transporter periplasmic adaptor subunit [Kofleriaceae bacterium]|jgi:membrane fusion protein (multidrug efflux system)
MRALVALTLLAACHKSGSDASEVIKPPVVPIKVTTIAAGSAQTPDVLVLTGTVAADQRSDVTADTQGKVINVMIERGQRVKIGQPVVQLDVRSAALSAREASAALASARVQKQLADDECVRTKTLLDKGAITKSEFDKQNTECLNAVEQVAQAQARNDAMAKTVSDGMVRAPFDGVVDQKNISPGEWVSPGKALFTLVADDPLKIQLNVPERAVDKIKKDMRVDVTSVAVPGKAFGATVTRLGAEIGQSRALVVEAQLDKGSQLIPGMFAEARVVIGESSHIVVPKTAVVRRDKTWRLFVDKDGTAEERIVQLGNAPSDDKVTVLQGVAAGEKVIANIDPKLTDGSKVTE